MKRNNITLIAFILFTMFTTLLAERSSPPMTNPRKFKRWLLDDAHIWTGVQTLTSPIITGTGTFVYASGEINGTLTFENDETITNTPDGDFIITANDDATMLIEFIVASSIDSPLVADNDTIAMRFRANDDSSGATNWSSYLTKILDASDESEDSEVQILTWLAGTEVNAFSVVGNLVTLQNGLTIDNATDTKLEFNENSDEFIWTFGSNTITASSSDVTLFDYGDIDLATDALDLSEGNISNVGIINLDAITADGTSISVNSPTYNVADGDTVKVQPYQEVNVFDIEIDNVSVFAIDTTTGKIVATGTYDPTIATTTAGGERGINLSISHDTNALTGTLYGIKANARVNVESGAGAVTGGEFLSGNMSAGYSLSAARGVYAGVTNKVPSGPVTWTYARGVEVNMDLDQGTSGNTNTITNAAMFYGLYNLPTTATYATVTNGYGIYLANEAVGGNGQALDAAVYIDDISMGGGVKGWDYGIDMTGVAAGFTVADINTSSGAKIFTGSAANGDAVYAEVGSIDATGSLYVTTAGALYVQVANAGAATDWFKCTVTDAD